MKWPRFNFSRLRRCRAHCSRTVLNSHDQQTCRDALGEFQFSAGLAQLLLGQPTTGDQPSSQAGRLNDEALVKLFRIIRLARRYDNPLYQPLQDTEYNAELYYGVHVTDWLTVRPNLQYIKQPGGVDEVDNALVAGIKIQTVFF